MILVAIVVPVFLFIYNGVRIQEALIMSTHNELTGSRYKRQAEPAREPVVPEYVHYVWTQTEGQSQFQFHNLLSILSVQRYLRPKVIMLHILADKMFLKGPMWKKIRKMSNIKVILRTYFIPRVRNTVVERNPTDTTDWTIFGKNITDPYHQSILARLKALTQYGGIYLDNDVIVQDSMEKLLLYDFTIGKDMTCVSPSILLARKNATFVQKWLNTFRTYDNDFYDVDEELARLILEFPDLVHVEKSRFSRKDLSKYGCSRNIFHGNCSHDDNYALKLYYNLYGHILDPTDINTMRSTFGQIARRLYYDTDSPAVKPRDYGVPGAGKYVVPNIVHFVWNTLDEFKFHHYLSALGALRYQKPDQILFHISDKRPDGGWWYDFKKEAGDVLRIVYRDKSITTISNQVEMIRIEVLLKHGGIYVDTDAMIVRNMDAIRHYNFSIGMDINGLNNGIILSAPESPFLQIYYESYKHLGNRNSSTELHRLASEHPDLIHIEPSALSRPQWTDWWDMNRAWRNGALVEWSHSYVINWMYDKFHHNDYNSEQIKYMNTTFGEVARHIYFGKKDIIWEDDYEDYE